MTARTNSRGRDYFTTPVRTSRPRIAGPLIDNKPMRRGLLAWIWRG